MSLVLAFLCGFGLTWVLGECVVARMNGKERRRRCARCQHWGKNGEYWPGWASCRQVSYFPEYWREPLREMSEPAPWARIMDHCSGVCQSDGEVATRHDFGCVLWEEA